jgi:hypothetical protein
VPWEKSRLELDVLVAETREDAALGCLNFDKIKPARLERCEEGCRKGGLVVDPSDGGAAHVARSDVRSVRGSEGSVETPFTSYGIIFQRVGIVSVEPVEWRSSSSSCLLSVSCRPPVRTSSSPNL